MMIRNLILMIILSVGLFTSCQKEEMNHGIGVDSSLINISFESSENLPQSRVSYTLNSDSSEYDFKWSVGDKVSLMITEPDTTKIFEFVAITAEKTSKFEGLIAPWIGSKNVYSVFPYADSYIVTGADDINRATVRLAQKSQTIRLADYKYENSFMVAAASGASAESATNYNIPSLHFKQVMTILKLNITNVNSDETVTNVIITSTGKVFLPYADIEISSGDIVDGPPDNDKEKERSAKVQGADEGVDTEVNMSFFPIDLSGLTMFIQITTEKGPRGEKVKTEYFVEKPGLAFKRNSIYSVSLPLYKPEVIAPTNNLKLTANEVFFSPYANNLSNEILESAYGTDENGNTFFSHTTKWQTNQDTLVWGVDVTGSGAVAVTPRLAVSEGMEGEVVEVTLAGETKLITLSSTGGIGIVGDQATVNFTIPEPGRYILRMNLKNYTFVHKDIVVADVYGANLAGTEGLILKPVLLHARPKAVHCNWKSTQVADYVLAVHENTMITVDAGMYCPITTSFGYFGSPWDNKRDRFGGINFSLWSPVNHVDPLPPAVEFSHIIAVGENLYVDGFNNEGTGVKARVKKGKPGPYDHTAGISTQVLAMCKVPGYPHDTYYSYYFDLPNEKWKLYACGKKYNKSGNLTYMKTGAFLEQPGSTAHKRNGHITREMQYSAWAMDGNRNWYSINQMNPYGGISNNSLKNWGIKTNDKGHDKFFMQMGGFAPLLTGMEDSYVLANPAPIPSYLQGQDLIDLIGVEGMIFKLPAIINLIPATDVTSNSATVNFDVTEIGTNPEVILYYGEYDGLTFVEGNKGNGAETNPFREGIHWDNIVSLVSPSVGVISHEITGLNANTKYYYRLQIISDQGETWSFDTQTFITN